MKMLREVDTPQFHLAVYECDCGFHIGVDATYIEQISEIVMVCPACNKTLILDGE